MNVIEILARAGYIARGVVYAVVGGFAVQAALVGGRTRSPDDAAPVLLAQPFGEWLVGLLALGLVGYAVWRAVQAVFDTDDHGSDAKGLTIRAGMLVSAAIYAGLALSAAALIISYVGSSGESNRQMLMSEAIRWIGATWTAAILAAIFVVLAGVYAVRAWRATFMRYFVADPEKRRWGRLIGRVGILARAGVFLVLGGLMGYRAWTARDSSEPPPSIAEVLRAVHDLPAGTWILLAMGFGLLAFAAYSVALSRYRRIDSRPLVAGSGWSALTSPHLSPLSSDPPGR